MRLHRITGRITFGILALLVMIFAMELGGTWQSRSDRCLAFAFNVMFGAIFAAYTGFERSLRRDRSARQAEFKQSALWDRDLDT